MDNRRPYRDANSTAGRSPRSLNDGARTDFGMGNRGYRAGRDLSRTDASPFRGKNGVVKSGRGNATRGKKNVPPRDEIKITSDLQITDGKLRGRILRSSLAPKGRPTPRYMRESMFRILARRVRAGRFLDLCAGCGTVGLEAISRGAMLATFVERSSKFASHLKSNLKECGIHENRGQVYELEAIPFLKRSARRKRVWDIVYVGHLPDTKTDEIIDTIGRGTVLARGGVAVIEHASEPGLPENLGVLRQWRTLEKDGNSLSFYNRSA